ncbi:MAG: SCP2 sterol-binding domain-containing protein [Rhodobacteraceae bacterium]|nr:SCP2 sterol-binding domain-containing protein [Paracoccaceae bacterium]MCY4136727.1 SCP2 sterol-binding domain-containing protein [Paracoccaceae bacterium]
MSSLMIRAADYVNEKLSGRSFDGRVRLSIEKEGQIVVDEYGARMVSQDGSTTSNEDVDCLVSTDKDTFSAVLDGHLDPMTAFMTGRLQISGDLGAAAKLGTVLR